MATIADTTHEGKYVIVVAFTNKQETADFFKQLGNMSGGVSLELYNFLKDKGYKFNATK